MHELKALVRLIFSAARRRGSAAGLLRSLSAPVRRHGRREGGELRADALLHRTQTHSPERNTQPGEP